MLSLLVTLLASAPLPAAPSASITCADGPASCDSAWVVMGAPAADRDEPRDYATPAEVECPTPAGDADLGECADEGPFDLWYRMSRFAQPDPGGVGSAPARRSAARGPGPTRPSWRCSRSPPCRRPAARPTSVQTRAARPRGPLRLPNARPGPDAAAIGFDVRAEMPRSARAGFWSRGACEVFLDTSGDSS